MAQLVCTRRLKGIGPVEASHYDGVTVKDVIVNASSDHPRLAHYILDDQGNVRQHIAIFVGGTLQPQESVLKHVVSTSDEIYIMQALSGG